MQLQFYFLSFSWTIIILLPKGVLFRLLFCVVFFHNLLLLFVCGDVISLFSAITSEFYYEIKMWNEFQLYPYIKLVKNDYCWSQASFEMLENWSVYAPWKPGKCFIVERLAKHHLDHFNIHSTTKCWWNIR